MIKIKIVIIVFTLILLSDKLLALEYSVPMMISSVVCADFDDDGDTDIIIGSLGSGVPALNDTITILLNNGLGEFTLNSFEKANVHTLFCEDMDGDEVPDLITKVHDHDIVYYKNYGDLIFGESNIIHTSLEIHFEEIQVADMDNDLDNDVIFYNRSNYEVDAYLGICTNDGTGCFEEEIIYSDNIKNNIVYVVGKLNDDNLFDILQCTNYGVSIFYNNSNEYEQVFVDSMVANFAFIKNMDSYNSNEIILYLESIFSSHLKIFYNIEENGLSDVFCLNFQPCDAMKEIADFNNDGILDLVITNRWNELTRGNIYIHFGLPDRTYLPPEEYYIGEPQWLKVKTADFDNNGYNDLVVTSYYINEDYTKHMVRVLFNDGTGNFIEEPVVSIDDSDIAPIIEFKLKNYPNPFNPITTISFSLTANLRNASAWQAKDAKSAKLEIFNIKGQKIKDISPSLCHPELYPPGRIIEG